MVSGVIVGLVPYNLMDPDTPMSTAFAENGMPWATYNLLFQYFITFLGRIKEFLEWFDGLIVVINSVFIYSSFLFLKILFQLKRSI